MKQNRIRFSIRSRLFLLTIVFLLLPYTAYRSFIELESSLRANMESSLLDVGNSLAAFLSLKEELIRQNVASTDQHLFIHELKQPINLDGYIEEWLEFLDWSNRYQHDEDKSFSYKLMLAGQEHELYFLIDVNDKDIVYHKPNDVSELKSDYVSLVFYDQQGKPIRYEFAPEAPGKIIPFVREEYWLHEEDKEFFPPDIRKIFITNVHGFWQETQNGYRLEVAVPRYLLQTSIGFMVNNFDTKNAAMRTLASFHNSRQGHYNNLIEESYELNSILGGLGLTDTRRIWVLDTLGQVMGVDGNLKTMIDKTPVNLLYEILLPKTYERFVDELSEATRLNGIEITNALAGEADTRWRSSRDGKAVILSAAVPIKIDDRVIGLVVVEETSNRIQILKRNAMARLFNRTLIIFVFISILFFIFATHLSMRIRRLSKQSSQVIDQNGRVIGQFKPSSANDELGELSRNYAEILERLGHYHEYLEGMASKLSHELRTPMTVVQSSLENMDLEHSAQKKQEYLARARQGIIQLNHLLGRLSEAARLEASLETSEFDDIELVTFLKNCIEGYKTAFPQAEFMFKTDLKKYSAQLAPELMVQLLDKLIANAVDFHKPETDIIICLEKQKNYFRISVINKGPPLAEDIHSGLFNSLTSHRDQQQAEPHLGLGLYIVRIIAEYHQGKAAAENLKDNSGVCFYVEIPAVRHSRTTSL